MPIPIRGKSLGNPAESVTIALTLGAKQSGKLRRYADALWAICAELGIRADGAFAQADEETGHFTSTRWTREGNPAGLGITTGMPDGDVQRTLEPEDWAVIHAVHLAGYAGIDPGPELIAKDFRWDAMVDRGWFGVADTFHDLDERWAEDGPNQQYGAVIEGRWRLYHFPDQAPYTGEETPDMPEEITFGRVPHPGYIDIQHEMADKPEGVGWDNLGKRQPKFIALHRMWGTLAGTRSYFGNPTVGSLTDYGIGVAEVDGADAAGVIHMYNDPRGYRSGWASGRVSAPYGDGLKFVNKYGVNAVNRDGVSFEISGYDGPIDDFAWGEIVKLAAYWCDQMEIPYSSLPLNPHTGINAFIWHEEFTIGTGKRCPFDTVKRLTNELYIDTAALLKSYQTGAAEVPDEVPDEPEDIPEDEVPAPQYASPVPIDELVPLPDPAKGTAVAVTTLEAGEFIFVGDVVEAIRETPRLRFATRNAAHVGPMIDKGERFAVDYMVRARDSNWYYITPYWTRVRVADCHILED